MASRTFSAVTRKHSVQPRPCPGRATFDSSAFANALGKCWASSRSAYRSNPAGESRHSMITRAPVLVSRRRRDIFHARPTLMIRRWSHTTT